jgi:hypothetical protein
LKGAEVILMLCCLRKIATFPLTKLSSKSHRILVGTPLPSGNEKTPESVDEGSGRLGLQPVGLAVTGGVVHQCQGIFAPPWAGAFAVPDIHADNVKGAQGSVQEFSMVVLRIVAKSLMVLGPSRSLITLMPVPVVSNKFQLTNLRQPKYRLSSVVLILSVSL